MSTHAKGKLPRSFENFVNWIFLIGLLLVGGLATAQAFTPVQQEESARFQWAYIAVPASVSELGELIASGQIGEAIGRIPAITIEFFNSVGSGDPTASALLMMILGGVIFGGLVSMGAGAAFLFKMLDKQIIETEAKAE